MESLILYTGVFLTCIMLLSLYRAVVGPTGLDRIMGMNAIGSKTVVLIVVIGLVFGRLDMFVDIALSYAMLNFIAVLAASRYLHKKGYHTVPTPKGGSSHDH
ncbi:MAG TPA: monovalent cation/H+ antiporter complex subunit F [Desulfomicrobiaceae bacterium]|jgi:multicomponent Na+:H+ antiporter subunit F|nr:monovalent cation/H+ antiporter complex subunit F [Desulfomicrobiaceae bacterium]